MRSRPAAGQRTGIARVTWFFRPGWLAVHLGVIAVVVTMVELGLWQLRVSDDKHFDLQNFSYTLQWWAFSICAIVFWLRVMRDAVRETVEVDETGSSAALVLRSGRVGELEPSFQGNAQLVARPGKALSWRAKPKKNGDLAAADGAPVIYRGYVIPESAKHPHRSEGDAYHEYYNDYLWQLGLADQSEQRRTKRQAD